MHYDSALFYWQAGHVITIPILVKYGYGNIGALIK